MPQTPNVRVRKIVERFNRPATAARNRRNRVFREIESSESAEQSASVVLATSSFRRLTRSHAAIRAPHFRPWHGAAVAAGGRRMADRAGAVVPREFMESSTIAKHKSPRRTSITKPNAQYCKKNRVRVQQFLSKLFPDDKNSPNWSQILPPRASLWLTRSAQYVGSGSLWPCNNCNVSSTDQSSVTR